MGTAQDPTLSGVLQSWPRHDLRHRCPPITPYQGHCNGISQPGFAHQFLEDICDRVERKPLRGCLRKLFHQTFHSNLGSFPHLRSSLLVQQVASRRLCDHVHDRYKAFLDNLPLINSWALQHHLIRRAIPTWATYIFRTHEPSLTLPLANTLHDYIVSLVQRALNVTSLTSLQKALLSLPSVRGGFGSGWTIIIHDVFGRSFCHPHAASILRWAADKKSDFLVCTNCKLMCETILGAEDIYIFLIRFV